MDEERQHFLMNEAIKTYVEDMETEEAQRGLAITDTLSSLGLEAGSRTPWFDASVVSGKLIATRILRNKVEGSDHSKTAATYASYRVEVAVTNNIELELPEEGGEEIDPELAIFELAEVSFTNTPYGIRHPGIDMGSGEDNFIDYEYDTEGWTNVEFTVLQSRQTIPPSGGGSEM